MLLAFGVDDDAYDALDVLGATLAKSGTATEARVGYRGGFVDTEVTWDRAVQMWSLLELRDDLVEGRFWCCFGIDDPRSIASLNIVVEINPRHEGTDLVVGGAFAKDESGAVHLCHNGKMGGGRKGVGKSAFFRHYSGSLEKMLYKDRLVDVVDLGPITSPMLRRRVARFVREVARIKQSVWRGAGRRKRGSRHD